jgi:YabP family.
MAYEEKKHTVLQHNIILESRAKMSVSGVENVDSFDDCELVIQTSQGNLIVSGSNLHIDSLNLDTGDLLVDGLVTGLVYEETVPSSSLWTKLFK